MISRNAAVLAPLPFALTGCLLLAFGNLPGNWPTWVMAATVGLSAAGAGNVLACGITRRPRARR